MPDARNAILISGPAGQLETVINLPAGDARALALVAHPHPLYGGTLDNKVTQTLASTFVQMGCVAARMNFRGVGASEGLHDQGKGETEDWLAVHEYLRAYYPDIPLFLAGFSFGAYVQSEVARHLPCRKLILVGPAVGTCPMGPVNPQDTLVIHGEMDDTIPLQHVLDWARPQDLPVLVIPGADHFFHRRLHLIRTWVTLGCHFG